MEKDTKDIGIKSVDQPTYKVVKVAENVYDSVVEMGNVNIQFTLSKVFDHMDYTEKKLIESKKQIEVNEALNSVLDVTMPGLKDIPQQQWEGAIQYFTRKMANNEYKGVIDTCEETIATYVERCQMCKDELGLEIPEKYLDLPTAMTEAEKKSSETESSEQQESK